ncbi:sensor histidine kinase [Streptomyces sp. NPDC048442]|uniref:sensor histidine kinase n=1 Tax=Streptomyces sp. NPDC048442 TaxID=3154823 RepID=UPI0034378670
MHTHAPADPPRPGRIAVRAARIPRPEAPGTALPEEPETGHPEEPETGRPEETGTGWLTLWDGLFAVSYLVTASLLLLTSDGGPAAHRFAALGALTAIVPWYALLGRPLMAHRAGRAHRTERTPGWCPVAFPFGLSLLFSAAGLFDLTSSFALFAVVPMLMMSLPLGPAIVLSTLANLWPCAVVLLHGGAFDPDVLAMLPISLLGLTLSVLLTLWITRVIQQSAERAELIDELRRSREQVSRLSHEAGVAAERERLAREIHDTVAQGLTSVISLLQAADAQVTEHPELAREHLGLAGRVARESLSEARHFVTALTPPPLQESSLLQAVRRQAQLLGAETGLDVRCTSEGVALPLPTAASVVLLRTAQEALANVRKHARTAQRVGVLVSYAEDSVRITVHDDGRGFPAGHAQDGYGLPGMRARAEQVGGTATVDSSPGRGTTIEVTVPREPATVRNTEATRG